MVSYTDLAGTQLAASTEIKYDDAGRIEWIDHTDKTAASFLKLDYQYDADHRITTLTRDGVATTFAYDKTDQLTKENAKTWSYDLNGNRADFTYVAENQIGAGYATVYQYDANGNLILTRPPKQQSGEVWQFGYDHRNQLVWVEKWQRTSGDEQTRLNAGGTVAGDTLLFRIDYKYDAWGNRIERRQRDYNAAGQVASDVTERHAVDGWDTKQDFWGNSATPVGTENFDVWADLDGANLLKFRRVYGDGVDDIAARVDANGVKFYHADHLGSIVGVVDGTTGTQTETGYDAWGQLKSGTLADRYGYTGREWDAAAELYHYRAREYDPFFGRFLQEDPLGYAAGDTNLYRYAFNSVANLNDPSGMAVPNASGSGTAGEPTAAAWDAAIRDLIQALKEYRAVAGEGAVAQLRDFILLAAINDVRARHGLDPLFDLDEIDPGEGWVKAGGPAVLMAFALRQRAGSDAGKLIGRLTRAGGSIESTTGFWCDSADFDSPGRRILITQHRNFIINWTDRSVTSAADHLLAVLTAYFDDNAVSDLFQLLANKLNHRLLAALRHNGSAAEADAAAAEVRETIELIALSANITRATATDQARTFAAGTAGGQAFAAITAFTRRVRAATELHHVIPKFLGRLTGQKPELLQRISAAAHDDFHKLLKKKLVERGFDRKMMNGGRPGSRRAWETYFKSIKGSQGKALRAVLDASREIDANHKTKLAEQVLSLLHDKHCFDQFKPS